MTILIEPEHICALKDVGELLTERIQQLSEGVAPQEGAWRIEIPVERLDILAWLTAQKTDLKIFWSSRDEQFETAGVGAAHEIIGSKAGDYTAAFRQMNRILDSRPTARYFGGFSFHGQGSSPKWQNFGGHRFILPRFEVCQKARKTVFACNILLNGSLSATQQSVLKELTKINFLNQKSSEKIPLVKSRQDHPSREQWMDTVKKALVSFKNSEYKKVVLARQSTFELSNILDPITFFAKIRELTPHCFHFLFQPSADITFIGASPERLYKRQGRLIESEAVAGTRPRGKTAQQDKEFQDELHESRKEELEHFLVVDAIKGILERTCQSFIAQNVKSLVKFKWGQHLVTQFKGNLKSSISDSQLLGYLHPTPAVAGCPTAWALEKIKKLEGFDRGWYAGPIGYIGHDQAEFAVAIRSGLISGKQLSLFAGAGIVEGSSPQEEWDEVEQKISIFRQVLNDDSSIDG